MICFGVFVLAGYLDFIYKAQICGLLDFMLSELRVLHARFVKLGIRGGCLQFSLSKV